MLFSIIECSITSLAINLLLPSWHLTCSCSQAICNAVFPIRSCLLIWMKIRVSNSISCKLKKKKNNSQFTKGSTEDEQPTQDKLSVINSSSKFHYDLPLLHALKELWQHQLIHILLRHGEGPPK